MTTCAIFRLFTASSKLIVGKHRIDLLYYSFKPGRYNFFRTAFCQSARDWRKSGDHRLDHFPNTHMADKSEQSQIELRTDESKKSRVLHMRGDLAIRQSKTVAKALLEALDGSMPLRLNLQKLCSIDLIIIQSLFAAHQHARKKISLSKSTENARRFLSTRYTMPVLTSILGSVLNSPTEPHGTEANGGKPIQTVGRREAANI